MRIESQRDSYPLQYESAERSTQQLLKSCDVLDRLWKKFLAKSTPPKKTPTKRAPSKTTPRKSPAKTPQADIFKTPDGQVLLILLDELKKSDWDVDKAITSLQTKTKGYKELQKSVQEVQEESQKPVSSDAAERFGSNPQDVLESLEDIDSVVSETREDLESDSDSTSVTDSDSTLTEESSGAGGSEVTTGESISGTDKDGSEFSGEVVQMSFGRPMIETGDGTTVTLTKWSSTSDDYSLFY